MPDLTSSGCARQERGSREAEGCRGSRPAETERAAVPERDHQEGGAAERGVRPHFLSLFLFTPTPTVGSTPLSRSLYPPIPPLSLSLSWSSLAMDRRHVVFLAEPLPPRCGLQHNTRARAALLSRLSRSCMLPLTTLADTSGSPSEIRSVRPSPRSSGSARIGFAQRSCCWRKQRLSPRPWYSFLGLDSFLRTSQLHADNTCCVPCSAFIAC